MRVIGGIAGSLPLKAPEGKDTRPTTDRIKETLFNLLQSDIKGGVFMDLFSGSGSIGIEALSRGAEKAYFVERDKRALNCIRKNLAFTGLSPKAIVLSGDVLHALDRIEEKEAKVIFMDPPYDMGLERKALERLGKVVYVTEHTKIVIEASLNTDFSYAQAYGFAVIREKRYKTNKHMFMGKRGL